METSSRFPGVLSFYPVARAEAVSRRDRGCGREEGQGVCERGGAGGGEEERAEAVSRRAGCMDEEEGAGVWEGGGAGVWKR